MVNLPDEMTVKFEQLYPNHKQFGVLVLLPKNDARFEVFQLLHRWLAWALLALVVMHVAGALKHRFFDGDPDSDVLRRML